MRHRCLELNISIDKLPGPMEHLEITVKIEKFPNNIMICGWYLVRKKSKLMEICTKTLLQTLFLKYFKDDSALAHALLGRHFPYLIKYEDWSPNSPDLTLVNYRVLGSLKREDFQPEIYHSEKSDKNHLEESQIIPQHIIHSSMNG
jgi:hypothetical protein